MRKLTAPKENEAPESFRRWKRNHPRSKYSNFHNHRAKADLKESLISRQKYLCCYCEKRVSDETSHIEHIDPQFGGVSPHTMDVSNMAISCIKDPQKFVEFDNRSQVKVFKDSMLHCGHARGTNRVVSPYDPRCEHMFVYSFSGEIKVNPDLKNPDEISLARDSIQYLRLNVPTLVTVRKIAMSEVVKLLSNGISATDIMREINGRLPPFVSSAKTAVCAFKNFRG